jgi:hypothetical protein
MPRKGIADSSGDDRYGNDQGDVEGFDACRLTGDQAR